MYHWIHSLLFNGCFLHKKPPNIFYQHLAVSWRPLLAWSTKRTSVTEDSTTLRETTSPSSTSTTPSNGARGNRVSSTQKQMRSTMVFASLLRVCDIVNVDFLVLDFNVESWCRDNFLNPASLETAESLRSELTDILSRIELPVSEPAFGTQTNTLNLKRALLSGFFMQVSHKRQQKSTIYLRFIRWTLGIRKRLLFK